MGTGIIIGMASLTVGSMVLEAILKKGGRIDEASYVSMTTTALMGITALTTFVKLVKVIKSLG